jgi:quercetin dioxygenase-like cupin family protein
MSTQANPAVTSIAVQPDAGEALWFLGALATVKASSEATAGRVTVIEFLAPCGHGSPLHIRKDHDQSFYVTEGELTFWLDGEIVAAPAGSYVYGPRGIPFRFTVSSEQARFLLVTDPGSFEEFMRELAEPALEPAIPPAATEPPDMAHLTATAADYGIEILGPPVPATERREAAERG